MQLNDIFPKRYARAEELQGKEVTLTIARVVPEKMRPNPKAPEVQKFVVDFREARKGVGMGKSLAYQLAEIAGSEATDNWAGKAVTLSTVLMDVAGRKVLTFQARRPSSKAVAGQQIPKGLADDDEHEHEGG
ncbi:MAG: hypothetical protein NTY53_16580 [Kiritimatiellaeota bacterium]|nr:hypothetical protein [Kiritimatiellota bacterium]